ncbi:MAG: HypC/HybG/HupF family hydrogenase formation chaperone [Methanobrevibacter sp.]|nr:HypC/HybG/HupF family hydrogenase formation chaperone [Methanobrevibacter sp.]
MCIAAPAKVVEINREEESLFADFGGVRQEAKINLLPDIEVGDYVLIHAGYAIEKLSEQAAKESLEAWEQLMEVLEEEDREMEKARQEMEMASK